MSLASVSGPLPPLSPTNSNQFQGSGPTGCRSWSTDPNNTLLASLCMFQPFDPHHGNRLHHLWESKQHTENDPVGPASCWGRSGSVDTGGLFFFFFSHWNIYHHNLSPLDQLYTCHVLWQWIINMSVISISSIDFCHSFEMDMLVLSLSLSVSSKNSWPQRTLQTYAAFPCHSVRCTPSLLMVFLQYVMVLLLTIFMMQLMIDWWITWSLKWHKYQKISMTPFRRWIEKPKHLRRTTILDK